MPITRRSAGHDRGWTPALRRGRAELRPEERGGAAATSNDALARLSPRDQWLQSYVAADRAFCLYLAEDERDIHEHARLSGFPATRVQEVSGRIDPATDRRGQAARSAA
ncbi:MAG: DUF4242 domain-containing protein [Pseudomonadales bacterium]